MEWLNSVEQVLNNPTVGNLLGLNKPAPAPKQVISTPPPATNAVSQMIGEQGMSGAMIALAVGGVVAIGAVLFFAFKK